MVPKPDTDRLIETYRSYAHALAAEVLRSFPSVNKDDVWGAAELGLVEAANSFDPARGVLFKTFAYYRIRGAIYDSLRKMGWFAKDPSRLRFESGANEYLKDHSEANLGSGSAQDNYQELKEITGSVLNSYFLSLSTVMEELPETRTLSAEARYLRREMNEKLRSALSRLPVKNRQVLESYYFGEETLESIGARLGLSKSWVSRLHAKSLDLLREAMAQAGISKAVPG
jgi:RNA polymerase sigma factor for flagellar operon FliA